MRCVIVRHGKAETASATGRDEDRVLKPRGVRQAEFLAAAFAGEGRRPSLIIASRFERAISTAHIIQKVTGAPLHLAPHLEVGHAASVGLDLIKSHSPHSPLMLVGHNPQLAELVWVLTKGMPPQDAGLRTGEAVELELDPRAVIGGAKELARLRLDGED